MEPKISKHAGLNSAEEDFTLKDFLKVLPKFPFYLALAFVNSLRLRVPFLGRKKGEATVVKKFTKMVILENKCFIYIRFKKQEFEFPVSKELFSKIKEKGKIAVQYIKSVGGFQVLLD